MNDIVNIGIEYIHPHPKNPRKDLGDLTEMVESIKKLGVMQNLTVIPMELLDPDATIDMEGRHYIALIGHRRLAAAKLAGLKELPCRVIELISQREQISTMLEENMQRNDLTIWEQANGFQMMLDLGDTEAQIAEKTGFSKTTIRHRLNIAKLNQEELQKKEKDENFQLTLKDLYELEKIEDVRTRDKVLKEATDSRDLVWKAKRAIREETRARNKKLFVEMFKKSGINKAPEGTENEKYDGKWDILQSWKLDDDVPKSLKKFKEGALWVVFWNDEIAVIVPAKKQKSCLNMRSKKKKKPRQKRN